MQRNRPLLAMLAASIGLAPFDIMKNFNPGPVVFLRPRGKRLARLRYGSTGKTYPHSSTRQRARYARQIAAGQLKMVGV